MLLASCDRATAVGRRDLAILTLLARLGLRAGEVAGAAAGRHRLAGRGEITVRGKGNRHERLPLPADVGEALVAYLQRVAGPSRPRPAGVRRHHAPRIGP